MKTVFSSRDGSDSDWDPVEIPSPSVFLPTQVSPEARVQD